MARSGPSTRKVSVAGAAARKEPRGQRDMSLATEEWRFEVGRPDHGARVDGFLDARIRWRSRVSLRRAIEDGAVEIRPYKDPQRAAIGRLRPGLRLRRGQEVVLRLEYPREGPVGPDDQKQEVEVLFEDAHLLAVNKPANLSVYPTRRHSHDSLIQQVHRRERALNGGSAYSPTLCHRLDRETSGVTLFAKDRASRSELGRQFEAREISKTYLALVIGELGSETGSVELPLARDRKSIVDIKMGVTGCQEGLAARTSWRLRGYYRGRSLVELKPLTGRQHQLRVHMAAIGHPIVGDKLYLGGDDLFLRSLDQVLGDTEIGELGLDRQALHAWRMELVHPASREVTLIEAPLAPDIGALL